MAESIRAGTGPTFGGPGPARYLLASKQPNILPAVAARLAADDRVRVVRAPTEGVLVIETSPTFADALRTEYAGALVVEPDAELDPQPPVDPTTDPTRPPPDGVPPH